MGQVAKILNDIEDLERRVSEQDQLLAQKHKAILRKDLYIEDLEIKNKQLKQRIDELEQLVIGIYKSHESKYGCELSSRYTNKIQNSITKL